MRFPMRRDLSLPYNAPAPQSLSPLSSPAPRPERPWHAGIHEARTPDRTGAAHLRLEATRLRGRRLIQNGSYGPYHQSCPAPVSRPGPFQGCYRPSSPTRWLS